jgi:hypothetical protein
MIGDPGSEQHRARVGFLVLAAGLLLLLWAWGSWFYRTSMPENVPAETRAGHEPVQTPGRPASEPVERQRVVRALPSLLLLGALLVVVFLFGTYAFLRFSRRYRQLLDRERPPPADSRDVWSMHQVPEYDDEDTYS